MPHHSAVMVVLYCQQMQNQHEQQFADAEQPPSAVGTDSSLALDRLCRSMSTVNSYPHVLVQNSSPTCVAMEEDMNATVELLAQTALTPRPRPKLGRTGSRSWFNKSFDQSILQQSARTTPARVIRRQNSVTDFFQNMISKSKSHLQEIFTSKKDKFKRQLGARRESDKQVVPYILHSDTSEVMNAEGTEHGRQMESRLYCNMKTSAHHISCPSLHGKGADISRSTSLNPDQINPNLDLNSTVAEKRPSVEEIKIGFPSNMSATMNLFSVGNSQPQEKDEVFAPDLHRPIVKNSRPQFSTSGSDLSRLKCKTLITSSLPSTNQRKLVQSPTSLSAGKYRARKIVTLSSFESSDSSDEAPLARRNASSAPPGRQSVWSNSSQLLVDDSTSDSKTNLVKSSSETFTKLFASPQPLVKASSNGFYFKNSSTLSLASSISTFGNVMISVTEYLFLGSIEAAYNEPLLCKYNISSLVDMTNVSPLLVPAHMKTDCPCSCVNKTHFRAKLNIGVDDIEWENLEQYFSDINAFINGARKNKRRVLVFSYNGLSRAAAAVIQHLMHHFTMPYREALNVVRSKRPQVKLNSGFVKALLRLEKRLGLDISEKEAHSEAEYEQPEVSAVSGNATESADNFSPPPVVRGAWLDC